MLPLRRPAGWMLSTARSVAVSRRSIVIGRDHGNFNTVLLMVPPPMLPIGGMPLPGAGAPPLGAQHLRLAQPGRNSKV